MVSATESASIAGLAGGIVRWLASTQQVDGNLRDPLAGTPLSPDHYGTSLFAAACTLAGDAQDATEPVERAVGYYLALPHSTRGAHELNNLGLLRVYRWWKDSDVGPGLRTRLARHLQRMPFASLTSPVTNNWHAMRAVCLAQRGALFGSERDRRAAHTCLHRVVLPLQGHDGLFADYPPPAGSGGRMTPLAYHAKFCAMLAMVAPEIDAPEVPAALARGVSAMVRFCAPDGESLFFGRSCNSVYGYASALYSTLRALQLGVVPAAEREAAAHAAARMAAFLWRMRQPDGSVRAFPTEFDAEQLGWDDYVHRLDYNAFAAFLLLQTPAPPQSASARLEGPQDPVAFDAPQDGFVVRAREGTFAAFSTRGQLHTGSYLFADARYAGMQPLTLQSDGRTIIPPPPHDADSPTDPTWVGFMPVISLRDALWAVRTYDEVRVIDGESVAILARGTPVALRVGLRRRLMAGARERRGRSVRVLVRRVAQLLRRMRVLTPPAYTVVAAPGVRAVRAMILLPRLRCLCLVDRIEGRFDRGWSTVRLAARCDPDRAGHRFSVDGLEGRVWTVRQPAETEVRRVFTSNGPAHVLRTPLVPDVAHVSAICFGSNLTFDADVSQGTPVIITVRTGEAIHRITVDLDALRVAHG